ncbi:MAG: substrate-binding domain-containing protein [Janthinobacterium lividum]
MRHNSRHGFARFGQHGGSRLARHALVLCAFAGTLLVLSTPSTAKGLKIGFSQVTLQSPFYVQLRDGAQAAAKADGDELIFLDANGDVSKQNNDIQDLLTRKVNVLIINPVNPDAVAPSLEAARRARVPVITVDRSVNEPVAARVGRNNVTMGEVSGKALVAALKKAGVTRGGIIEIQGDAGGSVMQDRRNGFHAALKGTQFTVIEGPYSEYIRANAVTAMQDLLQANPDVKAVYAHNDDMALGALQVLQESNRKDVLVAGVDGLSEALVAMDKGQQFVATAANDPRYLGALTIQTARDVAAGKAMPALVDAGTEVITKANVKQVRHDDLFGEYRPSAAQAAPQH